MRQLKQFISWKFEIFVLCAECDAYEIFRKWKIRNCSGRKFELVPTDLSVDRFFTIWDYVPPLYDSPNLISLPFPKNVGVLVPIRNILEDNWRYNQEVIVQVHQYYSYYRYSLATNRKIYGERGSQSSNGNGICLIDGRCAYIADTSLNYDVGVKVGDEFYFIVETQIRDGIVVATLDRDTNVTLRYEVPEEYERFGPKNDESVYFSAPTGLEVHSHEKPNYWPSIEFRNGYAVAIHCGESTFVNFEGYNFQVYASITSHSLALNEDRSRYTIKVDASFAVARRFEVTFEQAKKSDILHCGFSEFTPGERWVVFGNQVRFVSFNIDSSTAIVDSKSENMIRSIAKWTSFFELQGIHPGIKSIDVRRIASKNVCRTPDTSNRKKQRISE